LKYLKAIVLILLFHAVMILYNLCIVKNMRKNIYISLIILNAALLLSFLLSGSSFASTGPMGMTYSFRFENCTISEALREISQKSGVTIILKSDINKTIQGKSYNNRTLDKIITDLLRGENCAVVWNYNKGILASIGLYTFEKDGKGGGSRMFIPDMTPPIRQAESEIERNNEVLPVVHDSDSSNADENREIAASYMMARERARNGGTDNSLPESRFQGINRPMRRVNGAENGDIAPNSAVNSDTVNPGSDDTTVNNPGEVANVGTPEATPIIPDETSTPPSPETPDPQNFNGLEPPPMPPGL
jgi:hypothetical protein